LPINNVLLYNLPMRLTQLHQYLICSADVRDPPDSYDIRPRTARLFPEYGGLPPHRLFGLQRYHQWTVVSAAVASSTLPTTSSTSSSTTRRCALRAWSSSGCSSSSLSFSSSAAALSGSFGLTPKYLGSPPHFVSHNRVANVAISSLTTSSTTAKTGCIGIFFHAVLPRLRPRPPWRAFLLVPPTMSSGCALSLARPVLATSVCHFPPCVHGPDKPRNVSLNSLTKSTSASASLYDCLDASPSSSLASSPCATILMVPRAPTASCAAASSLATLTATLTTATLRTTSSTTATRPHARLPPHRHKGLPPCLSNLQPQHPLRIGRCDC